MADPTPAHLDPSALGTKEYWDTLYTRELTNHSANPRDEGTVWFDDSDAQAKMVAYLDEHALNHGHDHEHEYDPASAAVLDLGCGNGSMLFALRDEGWGGRLVGVDYSERSVELARAVGVSRREGRGGEEDGEAEGEGQGVGETQGEREVEFKVWDVLNGPLSEVEAVPGGTAGWDVVLDKGTFDAVSLSGERDGQGAADLRGLCCNWTEAELRDWFETKTRPTEAGGEAAAGGESTRIRASALGASKGRLSARCVSKRLRRELGAG
ncbi:hypothetical protein CHGG_03146 [Chaetomium globosum CBS 148.51]|uniref:Protein-lysine N-methyltransferase EFM4 n=1 Tax=Chaetomium globosum (strain ATCC 6205 / CBS 148.51 / DSM 1962 / NBRC 6347 / NRRL 1970) TaxID=306901 RepID=Q2H9F8_CHAGB|nr:uncharacterized protein CHGG_03146 [Chaetomium globosum CBS 148.51]EAQ91211.1 hypothetical protein CHGG_03146 [Chaetomium globosum CBS 148.51]